MSKKEPQVYFANALTMKESLDGAKFWVPKSEWDEIKEFVEKADYDPLKAENEKLKNHFDNCNSYKIVSLNLEVECLLTKLKYASEGEKAIATSYEKLRADAEKLVEALDNICSNDWRGAKYKKLTQEWRAKYGDSK